MPSLDYVAAVDLLGFRFTGSATASWPMLTRFQRRPGEVCTVRKLLNLKGGLVRIPPGSTNSEEPPSVVERRSGPRPVKR
jgi:hypothetical protein